MNVLLVMTVIVCGLLGNLERVIGRLGLLEKIPLTDKILVTSGRVSSEILDKVSQMGCPLLISRSAPTDRAIQLAEEAGLTLIARVRGNKMTIYTHPERVLQESE